MEQVLHFKVQGDSNSSSGAQGEQQEQSRGRGGGAPSGARGDRSSSRAWGEQRQWGMWERSSKGQLAKWRRMGPAFAGQEREQLDFGGPVGSSSSRAAGRAGSMEWRQVGAEDCELPHETPRQAQFAQLQTLAGWLA